MVADEILSPGEEHDGDLLQETRQEFNRGFRVPGVKGASYSAITLCPSNRFLDSIDVEGVSDLGLPQVRGQVHQIRGPVHATARVGIRESHIVHVDASIFAITLLGQPEHVG
jgi:hypothetical protein